MYSTHFHRIMLRPGIYSQRAYATKFVQMCPKPRYDTGCTYCRIPDLPQDKQINFEHNLNGTSAIPWKHVLVLLHGVTDFADMALKINLIPGSLAQDFEVLKRGLLSPTHPVTLSNALISGHSSTSQGTHRVRLYPDNVEVEFSPKHVQQFMEHYLLPEGVPQEVYNPFTEKQTLSSIRKQHPGLFRESTPKNDLVLICGHAKRDVRCGVLAPLLQREFIEVLKREDLSGDVDVGLISHIGGHAYAGNVIYFPADASRMPVTWYGRVFPEKVQGIVQATIKEGKIIRSMYRGPPEKC